MRLLKRNWFSKGPYTVSCSYFLSKLCVFNIFKCCDKILHSIVFFYMTLAHHHGIGFIPSIWGRFCELYFLTLINKLTSDMTVGIRTITFCTTMWKTLQYHAWRARRLFLLIIFSNIVILLGKSLMPKRTLLCQPIQTRYCCCTYMMLLNINLWSLSWLA